MQLTWDDTSLRAFEAGIDRGVFYPVDGPGVAWNGLTAIKESLDSTDQTIVYVDGMKQLNHAVLSDFSATIEAFTYPDEFLPYDGYSDSMISGQERLAFGLSYRSMIGNGPGYKLHLVYNCVVKPSARSNASLTDSSDNLALSWDLKTTPVAFPYDRPAAHIYIDSTKVPTNTLASIEAMLYGTDTGLDPYFPDISDLLSIFETNAIFVVIDNGDGTVTVNGPDSMVIQDTTDSSKWTLTSPSVIPLSDILYKVSSY